MTDSEYNKTVDLYADVIYRFALKHVKNSMAAQDIVQETFTKVWMKHTDVSYSKAKSYLFTTAYHLIVDLMKQESRNGEFNEWESKGSVDPIEAFDLQSILHQALDKLPQIQKTVILLRDYEGYHYAEIAEITSLNESQVKVYIFRARQTLKAYLKQIELLV
jgi:RNA polymerase sigma-70 factor (ECF subfamily)